jgi:hypothetical protein
MKLKAFFEARFFKKLAEALGRRNFFEAEDGHRK